MPMESAAFPEGDVKKGLYVRGPRDLPVATEETGKHPMCGQNDYGSLRETRTRKRVLGYADSFPSSDESDSDVTMESVSEVASSRRVVPKRLTEASAPRPLGDGPRSTVEDNHNRFGITHMYGPIINGVVLEGQVNKYSDNFRPTYSGSEEVHVGTSTSAFASTETDAADPCSTDPASMLSSNVSDDGSSVKSKCQTNRSLHITNSDVYITSECDGKIVIQGYNGSGAEPLGIYFNKETDKEETSSARDFQCRDATGTEQVGLGGSGGVGGAGVEGRDGFQKECGLFVGYDDVFIDSSMIVYVHGSSGRGSYLGCSASPETIAQNNCSSEIDIRNSAGPDRWEIVSTQVSLDSGAESEGARGSEVQDSGSETIGRGQSERELETCYLEEGHQGWKRVLCAQASSGESLGQGDSVGEKTSAILEPTLEENGIPFCPASARSNSRESVCLTQDEKSSLNTVFSEMKLVET